MCSTLSNSAGGTKYFRILNWQTYGKKSPAPMWTGRESLQRGFLQCNRIQSSEFPVKFWGTQPGVFPRLDSTGFPLRCSCGQKRWKGGWGGWTGNIETKQKSPLWLCQTTGQAGIGCGWVWLWHLESKNTEGAREEEFEQSKGHWGCAH